MATPAARRCWTCGNASGPCAAIEAIDPELAGKLPPLIASDQPAGRLQHATARTLDLNTDVLVSAGGGDNMMGAIGTGNVAAGRHHGELRHERDDLCLRGKTGGGPGRGDRGVLRFDEPLAAVALHDERDDRDGDAANSVRLDAREIFRDRRAYSGGVGRVDVAAVSRRRTDAERAGGHGGMAGRESADQFAGASWRARRWKA